MQIESIKEVSDQFPKNLSMRPFLHVTKLVKARRLASKVKNETRINTKNGGDKKRPEAFTLKSLHAKAYWHVRS